MQIKSDLPVGKIREDFPILQRKIDGHPLIYFDNAATSQMPVQVMDKIREHYTMHNANVHRGIHTLSNESTEGLESARKCVADFLHVSDEKQIIFTGGTTDSINLTARAFEQIVSEGDEVITTQMEHHSNFVPWQRLCERTGAKLRVVPLTENGELDLDAYEDMLSEKTRIIAVTHLSNVLGTVNPIDRIAEAARSASDAALLVDGAQGVLHGNGDLESMDCDFYCFSGHKILAPSGIGVLYGRRSWMERLEPVRFGGGMVDVVTLEHTSFEQLPYSWEAGTPNYAGAIALAEAITYLKSIGLDKITDYERELTEYLEASLKGIQGLTILGDPSERRGVLSFVMDEVHPYDAAALLDKLGIAVRSGHHCAQPLLRFYGLTSAIRVSPTFYNTPEEADVFVESLDYVRSILTGKA